MNKRFRCTIFFVVNSVTEKQIRFMTENTGLSRDVRVIDTTALKRQVNQFFSNERTTASAPNI